MCFMGRGMFLSWVVVEYLHLDSVVFVFLGGMFAKIHAVGPPHTV
jgi:hypothetical protein